MPFVSPVSAVGGDAGHLAEVATAHQQGQVPDQEEKSAVRYLADIRVNSVAELQALLYKVENFFQQPSPGTQSPVVFLLHGEEARALLKSNYAEHKTVVDLAARLSAFEYVDIRVCETWASKQSLDVRQLQPFIRTVPFAVTEEKRLIQSEGYLTF